MQEKIYNMLVEYFLLFSHCKSLPMHHSLIVFNLTRSEFSIQLAKRTRFQAIAPGKMEERALSILCNLDLHRRLLKDLKWFFFYASFGTYSLLIQLIIDSQGDSARNVVPSLPPPDAKESKHRSILLLNHHS